MFPEETTGLRIKGNRLKWVADGISIEGAVHDGGTVYSPICSKRSIGPGIHDLIVFGIHSELRHRWGAWYGLVGGRWHDAPDDERQGQRPIAGVLLLGRPRIGRMVNLLIFLRAIVRKS